MKKAVFRRISSAVLRPTENAANGSIAAENAANGNIAAERLKTLGKAYSIFKKNCYLVYPKFGTPVQSLDIYLSSKIIL